MLGKDLAGIVFFKGPFGPLSQPAQQGGVIHQPCHTAGRCLDCRSKSRGCNALLVLWGQMMDMAKVEVVLIDEPLGL